MDSPSSLCILRVYLWQRRRRESPGSLSRFVPLDDSSSSSGDGIRVLSPVTTRGGGAVAVGDRETRERVGDTDKGYPFITCMYAHRLFSS